MARKKKGTQMDTHDTNGTTAVLDVPVALPVETQPPVNEVRPEPELQQPAPANNGNGRHATNEPVRTFSYPVSRDTWVQALVFERHVTLKDNTTFVTHEVSVRKLWTTPQGEVKALYLFRGSELYALAHAVERAERWILDSRETDCPF